jgi:hypothetical protein
MRGEWGGILRPRPLSLSPCRGSFPMNFPNPMQQNRRGMNKKHDRNYCSFPLLVHFLGLFLRNRDKFRPHKLYARQFPPCPLFRLVLSCCLMGFPVRPATNREARRESLLNVDDKARIILSRPALCFEANNGPARIKKAQIGFVPVYN